MNTEIVLKKPDWIRIKLTTGDHFNTTYQSIKENGLHTVCEEALCPNRSECWSKGTATIMILGDTCTRSCRFCNIKTGRPTEYDENEPIRAAEAVKKMGLKHVVITSVDRDELKDGGSTIWAETIRQVRNYNPQTSIEVLTPDFKGKWEDLKRVLDAKPNIFSHNIETVRRITRSVRPQAYYDRSLSVLKMATDDGAVTKTGLMLGLGETLDEVKETMKDALNSGVKIFTLGQYLRPTKDHLPVQRYVHPDEFKEYKEFGMSIGFEHVESGPLVRSSYHAEEQAKQASVI